MQPLLRRSRRYVGIRGRWSMSYSMAIPWAKQQVAVAGFGLIGEFCIDCLPGTRELHGSHY